MISQALETGSGGNIWLMAHANESHLQPISSVPKPSGAPAEAAF